MTDQDFTRWAAAWRENADAASGDLARLARRERRTLLAWIVTDWILGAALLAFAAWLWFVMDTPAMRYAAGGITAITVGVLAFSVHNWRGSLRADGASAAEFIREAERRGRARLRYVRFGWWILAANLIVIAGAVSLEIRDEGAGRLLRILALTAVATAATAALLKWLEARERRRARRWSAMKQAMQNGRENGDE